MKLWLATPAALLLLAAPAWAQNPHAEHQGHQPPAQQAPDPHAQHRPADGAVIIADQMRGGALGAPAFTMEASGTSWQPSVSSHGGVHARRGDWMVMSHAFLNGVFDWQDGPRGDEKAFISGMVMSAARREFGAGTLNLRAMLSPDPLMGRSGFPSLFSAGETANGAETLIDRQHPHDLIMELSASYAHRLGAEDALFFYAGLPGEPAFGPPAFMHRMSAMDSPEAPISHHWFDSTHITFGIVTAGWVHRTWKLEASRFRGREPDQHRYDIENGELDSTSARISWNPTSNLALQMSWADITSPEALEPDENEERWSASAIYTRRVGDTGWWSLTGAFANKERSDGVSLDAWLGEAALHPNENWTFFARGERIETDELEPPGHGPIRTVARLSVGAVRDWRLNEHAVLGVGALAQHHFAPDALEAAYDGDPQGAMAFVRLKIG